MDTFFRSLRKKTAKITLFAMMFSLLSPLGTYHVSAFSGTFTASQTTANVPEVKASRTLTVGVVPADAETITVGTCIVTFSSILGSTSDELNCTDNAATVDLDTGAGDILRLDSEIADVLDTLTNVSDAAHGALTVGTGAATTTVFTTTGTETSGTNITFTDGTAGDITATTTVTGVIPVAQVVDFTPAIPTSGETYRATINGTNFGHTVLGVETVQQVVEDLQPVMDSHGAVSCSEDDTKVTCTSSTAGTSFLFAASVIDITPPVISETTPVTPNPTNDPTPNYTFTSSETGAITYAGGCTSTTTGALVGANNITFNSLADGTYAGCTIRVTDGSSNQSNLLGVTSFTVDTTAPTVALTTGASNPTNGAFTVTATFSEAVTGALIGDFVVSNATTSAFNAVSSTVYTVLVTPSSDGAVTVNMGAGAAFDAANNPNTAAAQLSRTYDGTAPSVVLSTPAPNPTNAAFTVTATFSEPVTGVAVGDFVVVNGNKSAFTALSSTGYTVLVTPIADGAVTIDMPGAAATDTAGNSSTVATQLSRNFDGTPPSVILSTPAGDPTNAPFTVTATFSEPVTGITGGDFVVSNASTGSFSAVSSTVYTIVVSPTTDGPVTIDMPAGAGQDALANLSTAATQLTRDYDGTDPTVVLSTPAASHTNVPFTVTATFSEPVTGVTSSDFAVVNGSKTAFTAVSSTVYTVLVTPAADGTVTVDMATAAATDLATNVSTAATQLSRIYDATAPVISETTAVTTPTNDTTPNYTFTSDEAGTISYTGGCTSVTTNAVVGANTITLSSLTEGTYATCTITVTDAATNASNVLALTSFTIDTTIPTVALTTPAPTPTNAAFTVTATFSEPVTGVAIGDFVVTNGTKSAFTAVSSTVYTVLVTPTADGAVTINMPLAAAQDLAGNTNSAAVQLSRTYDGTSPTVTLSTTFATATNAPFTVTATFSEPVTGITSGDFAVANASTSAFTGSSSTVYTILVTPTLEGTVTVNMAGAAGVDSATNTSVAATQLSRIYDTTSPTVALSTTATNPIYGDFTVTATFSEAMTGVDASDFSVTNGTVKSVTAISSSVYDAVITPTSNGSVGVTFPAAVATDIATNNNLVGNSVSTTYYHTSGGGGGGGGGGGSSAPITVVKATEKTETQTGATSQTGAVTQTGSISETGAVEETQVQPEPKNTFAEILEKALKDRENNQQETASNNPKTTSTPPSGNLGNQYVESLLSKGAINTSIETFRPNDDITRAELLKIVMKLNNIDYTNTQPNTSKFTDLDKNAWSSKVASKAVELGVTNGYNDGTFKPDTPITRIEALKFTLKLSNFDIPQTTVSPFVDVHDGWMIKYLALAKNLGIVSGQETENGPIFRPLDTLTRLEAAKIVIKADQSN